MRVLIAGAGVIGQGWAIRFALFGWDVLIYDQDSDAGRCCAAQIERVRAHVQALYPNLPSTGQVAQVDDPNQQVDWVQESLPEELAIKQAFFASLVMDPDVPICSSTSGFKPSVLMSESALAEQFLVCHPFNPVYLLPLVEVVPHQAVAADSVAKVRQTLVDIGMKPLLVKREIDAHIADRLLEAVWREALWLVEDDVATTEDIDAAIKFGFGLRWAQMGLFETYRLAGGEGGMAHFLAQFGPALQWPWSRLTDVPDLDQALIDKIASQSDAQSGHLTIEELTTQRDQNLVAIMQALTTTESDLGKYLERYKN